MLVLLILSHSESFHKNFFCDLAVPYLSYVTCISTTEIACRYKQSVWKLRVTLSRLYSYWLCSKLYSTVFRASISNFSTETRKPRYMFLVQRLRKFPKKFELQNFPEIGQDRLKPCSLVQIGFLLLLWNSQMHSIRWIKHCNTFLNGLI